MLTPILRSGLDVLFVGFNPHPYSWDRGKYYAHGSLWRILRKSGLGEIHDDSQLLGFNYGITDLVPERPTREAHEVTDEEYARGARRLKRELKRLHPRVACFTGKGAYGHFAGLKTSAIAYGFAGTFAASILVVVPFPSHKWMTDAAKVEHYRVLLPLLDERRVAFDAGKAVESPA